MAINITTDKQNAKYAESFQGDLEGFFELFKSEIIQHLKDNPNLTVDDIEIYIEELLNGIKELS